jgi:hypothetical protein
MFVTLSCPSCGATTPGSWHSGAVVVCQYCNTSYRVAASQTPEPDLGDLLLGADFRDPTVPGWVLPTPQYLAFKPGTPAELWAKFPESNNIHPVLRTPAPFDDFDISVTIRFTGGVYEQISAGVELRFGDEGDYVIRISAQGTFSVGWHDKTEWGGYLVKWTDHPSLRRALGDPNRLRVVLNQDRIRVFLNGVLATSLRDQRFSSGLVRVVVSPGKKSAIEAAFSDLQLRELPRE